MQQPEADPSIRNGTLQRTCAYNNTSGIRKTCKPAMEEQHAHVCWLEPVGNTVLHIHCNKPNNRHTWQADAQHRVRRADCWCQSATHPSPHHDTSIPTETIVWRRSKHRGEACTDLFIVTGAVASTFRLATANTRIGNTSLSFRSAKAASRS
jgi:hypothetical protein